MFLLFLAKKGLEFRFVTTKSNTVAVMPHLAVVTSVALVNFLWCFEICLLCGEIFCTLLCYCVFVCKVGIILIISVAVSKLKMQFDIYKVQDRWK